MSDTINIGGITVSKFYLGGSSDVKIYLGTTKLYPNVDYSNCFKFVATNSGTFTFTGNDIDYSLDSGATWATLSNGNATPTITAGSIILWKANGLTPTLSAGIGTFSSTANFTAAGNVMSLLYGDNFEGQTSLAGKEHALRKLFAGCTTLTNIDNMSLPATTLSDRCYRDMFGGCTSLTSIENLVLPATTLANYCYYSMFNGCTSLTTVPSDLLPATTLAENCYNSMFNGCTSLTTVPSDLLPATTLAKRCYYNMFQQCTSLTTPPQLPATTLATGCYYNMFYQNSSLRTSPVLSAETLVQDCYRQMFYNCRSLNKIICLATDISASNCTSNWVSNVAASGTFYKASGMSSWTTGNSGIPTSWTIVDYSPYKLVAQHSDLTEYKVACNASSVLSSAETKADSASASTRNVTIGDCVTELGAYTFNSFANLTGVTLPSGLTTIGERCFDSTHGITSITLPNSVVSINDSAFRHMHGLKELNIPSGVTTIPYMCFNDCTALSSFTIPSNITAISGNAFSYCTALKEVHFQGTTPPVFGTNVFNGSTNLEKIYIPSCDNYDAYAAALPNYTDLIYAEGTNTKCQTTTPSVKMTQANSWNYSADTNSNVYRIQKSASSSGQLTTCYISVSGVSEVVFTLNLSSNQSGINYSSSKDNYATSTTINSTASGSNTWTLGGLTQGNSYTIRCKLIRRSGQYISGTNAGANITWTS